MTSFNMEAVNSVSSTEDPMVGSSQVVPAAPLREKSKRPQLSCNPCRNRKVKCDRIQPCTACSLHQIAECCQYDLSESERQPILQAEALKEKDKEIARLRNQILTMGGQPVKVESPGEEQSGRASNVPPRVPKKPADLGQRRFHSGSAEDNIYFGAPGLANVIKEFAKLSVQPKAANLTHQVPRGADIFAFQMATSHPFPTLWSAKDQTVPLVQCLPPDDEIFAYLDAFQRRAQSCSFPHVPEECTKTEVRRFLDNRYHNAAVNPDMLALLFTTIAQGLQNGCYDKFGGQWWKGGMALECEKGDVYIAAAMQALRLAAFMNRPTLLAIETLVMIGPYLTNSGKFLDAWALFGLTIRLAQSIGLHRDPNQLNPPPPLEQIMVRKNLWWWMLHMDQQYSMTLGRPLGISSMGDCPAPVPLIPDPVIQSLSNYIGQFTILARQILSSGHLTNVQIDSFTDQLLALKETLPEVIQFDGTWVNEGKPVPQWPLDAQAAVFYGKTHNFLILLNRQRAENTRRESNDSVVDCLAKDDSENVPRGRERVLQSCRALLEAFDFFGTRVRVAMVCWTMGQQAFNAAMILTLNIIETGDTRDLPIVQKAYAIFVEMNLLGIHKLAGVACEKLAALMKQVYDGTPTTKEGVMGQQGMVLLEDPGLQGFVPGGFSPLGFRMAGGEIEYGNTGTGWSATTATGIADAAARSNAAQVAMKLSQRKEKKAAGLKPKVPAKKPTLITQQRPSAIERSSGHNMATVTSHPVRMSRGPSSSSGPPSATTPLNYPARISHGPTSTSAPASAVLASGYPAQMSRSPGSGSGSFSAVLSSSYSDPNVAVGFGFPEPAQAPDAPSQQNSFEVVQSGHFGDPAPAVQSVNFEATSRPGVFPQPPPFSHGFGSTIAAARDGQPDMYGAQTAMPTYEASRQYAPQPGPPSYAATNAHGTDQMPYSSEFSGETSQMPYPEPENDDGMNPWERAEMEGWL